MASNAGQESSNRISSESADNINTSKKLAVNPDEKEIGADNSKEEPLSIINAVPISSDVKQVVAPNTTPTTVASQLVSTGATGQLNVSRPLNIYAPPPQAHSFYYGGYNNVSSSEWDKNVQYLNQEGIEPGSNSTYSENPLMFHTGYGFSPSGAYGGPYSPVTTPLPSAGSDGQLYSPQQYSITGHYYQQPLPPSLSFLNSPTPVSQGDFAMPAGVEHRGSFLPDPPNSNGALFEPKPNYTSHGTFGRNSYSGNPGYYDFRQGFDGFFSSGSWPDWSNATDTQNNIMSFYSPADSPQPISTHGSFGHNVDPFASRLAPQQQNSFYGYGSSINTLDRGYSHGGLYRGTNFGENGQNWIGNDKGTRRGKGDTPPYSFNGTPDFLSEQSRGPRATKPKSSETEPYSQIDGRNRNSSTATVNSELYNQPDFTVEHKDARFFVIKSYSEDNVHKSIKYGLWASTPNGNRKLDTAYREAKEKGGACPVFLFFSVNSSAQFCGVAEMIGNVDFNKSVDYWQQDKWSGNFPVKWHIVKDVPNSMFRHIILENNDKKPVTNSRDTQEIKLKQGLEMLNIFKEHESSMSILEDFDFYEEREKAMKERKTLHKQQQQSTTMPSHLVTSSSSEHQRPSLLSSVYKVNQMAEDFVRAVRLDEISTENTSATAESSSIVCAEKTKAEHSTNTSSITDSK